MKLKQHGVIFFIGTIPVVVGAPNIQDFAPSPNSVLHIKKLTDVMLVAKTMKQLSQNLTAYNESLRQVSFVFLCFFFSFYLLDNKIKRSKFLQMEI